MMEVQFEIIILKLDLDRLKLIWRSFTSAKEGAKKFKVTSLQRHIWMTFFDAVTEFNNVNLWKRHTRVATVYSFVRKRTEKSLRK